MSPLHYNIRPMRKKHAHLTYEIRQKLKGLIQSNHKMPKKKRLKQFELALVLECSNATISREMGRGKISLLNYDLTPYESYSAAVAQNYYDYQATNKGPDLKLGHDSKFIEYVENKVLVNKWSPDAIIMDLDKQPQDKFATHICTRTLYNYIELGLFYNLKRCHLPRRGLQKKRKYHRVRRSLKSLDAPLITERPIESTDRLEPGHWEMDCIVSGKSFGYGKAALLTLNDRNTRESIIVKLKAQTQVEVLKALNQIERKSGRSAFHKRFKTITVDNGSEFLDWKGIERSVTGTKKVRTNVYFCHPYSSFERGTNEQNNGIIRYWIPKGAAIKDYSQEDISHIQNWLNNYPRRILRGLTAIEAKAKYNKVAILEAAAASATMLV